MKVGLPVPPLPPAPMTSIIVRELKFAGAVKVVPDVTTQGLDEHCAKALAVHKVNKRVSSTRFIAERKLGSRRAVRCRIERGRGSWCSLRSPRQCRCRYRLGSP